MPAQPLTAEQKSDAARLKAIYEAKKGDLGLTQIALAALCGWESQGYVRQDGSYVQPHYQTAPNNTVHDNYSTKGNTNPYTGQAGTVNPDRAQGGYHPQQPTYQPSPTYRPAQPTYPQKW